jgi:hypothetical protein
MELHNNLAKVSITSGSARNNALQDVIDACMIACLRLSYRIVNGKITMQLLFRGSCHDNDINSSAEGA